MKTWWEDEPIIVHSNRWKVIENDLLQNMKQACINLRNTFNRPSTKKQTKKGK